MEIKDLFFPPLCLSKYPISEQIGKATRSTKPIQIPAQNFIFSNKEVSVAETEILTLHLIAFSDNFLH